MEAFVERASQTFKLVIDVIEPYLPLIAGISIAVVLASMVIIPLLIVKMPADYFVDKRRRRKWTIPRIVLYVLRNVLALVLFLAGLLMLVLPGQGLLTLIIAVMVSDFPGKFAFERWLLRQKGVLRSMNWVRKKYNKPNVQVPDKEKIKDS